MSHGLHKLLLSNNILSTELLYSTNGYDKMRPKIVRLFDYYVWFKKNWAKIGFILAIYLFTLLIFVVRHCNFVLFVLLLHTPVYMLHQTEEYVFPGGFREFFITKIYGLSKNARVSSDDFIFYLNVILIWIVLPTFAILSTMDYAYGLWIPYFSLFAGVAHVALSIKARTVYNPGLVVSLVLNIPIGLWSIIYLKNIGLLDDPLLNPYMAIGLAINMTLPVLGVIMYKRYMRRT